MNFFLISLLYFRIFVDGYFNFKFLGLPISGYLSAMIILVFLTLMISSRLSATVSFSFASLAVFASSFLGFIAFGIEPVFEAVRFISIICVFYLALSSRRPIRIETLTLNLSLAAIVNISFQLFQQSSGEGLFVGNFWRYAGLFAHPNTAALFYGLIFILAFYQLVTRTGLSFGGSISVLMLALTGIALTLSIGGFLFLLVASVTLLLTLSISNRRKLNWFGLVLGTLGLSALVFPNASLRFASYTLAESYVYGDQTNSLVWRLNQWQQYLELAFSQPFFGLGFGSSTSGQLVPNALLPHNEYLRFFVEVGLLGLIFALFFIGRLLKTLAIASKNPTNWAAKCTVPVLIGFLVNAVAENTFIYTVPMFILAILVANSFRAPEPKVMSETQTGQN